MFRSRFGPGSRHQSYVYISTVNTYLFDVYSKEIELVAANQGVPQERVSIQNTQVHRRLHQLVPEKNQVGPQGVLQVSSGAFSVSNKLFSADLATFSSAASRKSPFLPSDIAANSVGVKNSRSDPQVIEVNPGFRARHERL